MGLSSAAFRLDKVPVPDSTPVNFRFAQQPAERYFGIGLSGGVMVAQGPLEAFVMVRIHVGQPL